MSQRLAVALAVAGLSLLPVSRALPAGRPSTLAMSCAQAQSLVRSRGSVVLSTGPRHFDRYVSGYLDCDTNEYPYRGSVPTADIPSCNVGYVCTNEIPDWLINRF